MIGGWPPVSKGAFSQQPRLQNLRPVASLSLWAATAGPSDHLLGTELLPRASRRPSSVAGSDRTQCALPLDHSSPLELSQGNVGC